MKRREFLVRMGVLGLIGLGIGLGGCTGSDTGTVDSQATATTTAAAYSSTADTQITNDRISALAGTCPKGRACTSPQCHQWIDSDGNGICDRGDA